MQANGLHGVERALVLADPAALASHLEADPTAATSEVGGLAPLLVVLRRSTGSPADVRGCVRLLLDAGADPDSNTIEWDGQGRMSALFDAVERGDLALVRLLLERGAAPDEDAFYHACGVGIAEQSCRGRRLRRDGGGAAGRLRGPELTTLSVARQPSVADPRAALAPRPGLEPRQLVVTRSPRRQ